MERSCGRLVWFFAATGFILGRIFMVDATVYAESPVARSKRLFQPNGWGPSGWRWGMPRFVHLPEEAADHQSMPSEADILRELAEFQAYLPTNPEHHPHIFVNKRLFQSNGWGAGGWRRYEAASAVTASPVDVADSNDKIVESAVFGTVEAAAAVERPQLVFKTGGSSRQQPTQQYNFSRARQTRYADDYFSGDKTTTKTKQDSPRRKSSLAMAATAAARAKYRLYDKKQRLDNNQRRRAAGEAEAVPVNQAPFAYERRSDDISTTNDNGNALTSDAFYNALARWTAERSIQKSISDK